MVPAETCSFIHHGYLCLKGFGWMWLIEPHCTSVIVNIVVFVCLRVCACLRACAFLQVLFPLLTKLLDNISPADVGGMEETRMRACTLLSKVSLTVTLNTHTGRHTQIHTHTRTSTLSLTLSSSLPIPTSPPILLTQHGRTNVCIIRGI